MATPVGSSPASSWDATCDTRCSMPRPGAQATAEKLSERGELEFWGLVTENDGINMRKKTIQ
jgi:hypothetical protein